MNLHHAALPQSGTSE